MKYFYKDALYLAAEYAYKEEVVDTGMVEHIIGEWKDYESKEDWISSRVDEWLEEAAIKRGYYV